MQVDLIGMSRTTWDPHDYARHGRLRGGLKGRDDTARASWRCGAGMKITRFRDEHFFLSNFYGRAVRLGGVLYPTAEAAFQAAKTLDPIQRERIRQCASPAAARAAGRRVTLRPGWDTLRLEVMRGIVRQKFRDPLLAGKLLATGDAWLEEGNTHGDRFWGTVNGQGENWLGRILMEVREELRAAQMQAS